MVKELDATERIFEVRLRKLRQDAKTVGAKSRPGHHFFSVYLSNHCRHLLFVHFEVLDVRLNHSSSTPKALDKFAGKNIVN